MTSGDTQECKASLCSEQLDAQQAANSPASAQPPLPEAQKLSHADWERINQQLASNGLPVMQLLEAECGCEHDLSTDSELETVGTAQCDFARGI